jgi:hypothetical protein
MLRGLLRFGKPFAGLLHSLTDALLKRFLWILFAA